MTPAAVIALRVPQTAANRLQAYAGVGHDAHVAPRKMVDVGSKLAAGAVVMTDVSPGSLMVGA